MSCRKKWVFFGVLWHPKSSDNDFNWVNACEMCDGSKVMGDIEKKQKNIHYFIKGESRRTHGPVVLNLGQDWTFYLLIEVYMDLLSKFRKKSHNYQHLVQTFEKTWPWKNEILRSGVSSWSKMGFHKHLPENSIGMFNISIFCSIYTLILRRVLKNHV